MANNRKAAVAATAAAVAASRDPNNPPDDLSSRSDGLPQQEANSVVPGVIRTYWPKNDRPLY